MAAPFIPSGDDLRPFAAELWLIGGIAANLLVPFFNRRPNFWCAAVTLACLVLGIIALVVVGDRPALAGPHLHGMLLSDSIAWLWKIVLLGFVAGVVVLWIGHSGRSLRQGDGPEYFILLLGATLGMCLMASTTHLLMIFMAVAIASLPGYLLAGFAKQNKRSAEASLKYVLLGAVTSAILIYGTSFLYGLYGTLQLSEISPKLSGAAAAALAVALIGLLVGIGFKISAVPLHFWCPDVFEGAQIEVTTFLSVASKGAALILLLRIVQAMPVGHLAQIVGLIGAITATVGNTAAFTQNNIKRLLAYSSIAQAGYMMCLIAGVGGSENSPGGSDAISQALILYLVIYAVMNLGAFAAAAIVIRQHGERLENFAGLGRSSPLVAGSLFCCLVSLIGLPPLAGFGAKVNILWVLAGDGKLGAGLVVVIVLNTVLSAFYYFRIIRGMYLEPASDQSRTRRLFSRDPLGVLVTSVCAGGLVVLFFGFGPLYAVTAHRGKPTAPGLAEKHSSPDLFSGRPGGAPFSPVGMVPRWGYR
jgi:NADH-quinone oxidoreductase subunit N